MKLQLLARHALMVSVALLVMALLGVIAGCAAPLPTLQPVKVPVPVPCQETVPDRPAMPTEAFAQKPTVDAFVQASAAEIERREGYEKQLRTALQACIAPIDDPATKGASDGHTQHP
jgi:hypothetical protein